MKRVRTFEQFVNENLNEGVSIAQVLKSYKANYEEDEMMDFDLLAKAWVGMANVMSKAKETDLRPEDFGLTAFTDKSVIGVWGEDDDRDYSSINVITANASRSDIDPDDSPMDWSLTFDEMGIEYETETFSYKPDSDPKSILKAAKDAEKFIQKAL